MSWMQYMSIKLNEIFLSNNSFQKAFVSVCLYHPQMIPLQFKANPYKIFLSKYQDCLNFFPTNNI